MVQRREQRTRLFKRAKAIKAHSILPLKNVTVFPMLWSSIVYLNKPLYLLEPGDDALLARRASDFLLGLCEFVQFLTQFVEVDVSHTDPRPCSGQTQRRLLPSVFPKRPARLARGADPFPS